MGTEMFPFCFKRRNFLRNLLTFRSTAVVSYRVPEESVPVRTTLPGKFQRTGLDKDDLEIVIIRNLWTGVESGVERLELVLHTLFLGVRGLLHLESVRSKLRSLNVLFVVEMGASVVYITSRNQFWFKWIHRLYTITVFHLWSKL